MRIKFLLILMLNTGLLFAQRNRQFQFSQLNITNGLSHNQVTAIYKDSQGFMWFGTLAGLNRYDGFQFKTFKHSFKDKTTINDDFIISIQEGPEGKLWVLTPFGYNIYDPETEKFDHQIKEYLDKINIPWQNLTAIKKDLRGDFWFVNSKTGIYRYASKTKKTIHYHHQKNNNTSLYTDEVSAIAEDSSGNFWVIYPNGVMDKIDAKTHKVSFRTEILKNQYLRETVNYTLSIDKQNDLWIFHSASDIGLYYYQSSTQKVKHFSKNSTGSKLNSNIINNVIQDEKGLIWIATDHGGINLLDKKDFSIRYLLNRENDLKSVSQNSIISMYKDNTGIFWIGTFKKGISYYHENIIKFPLIRHYPASSNSLIFDDVNRFVEDAKGNLWIGTNGEGLIYFDRQKNSYTQFKHNATNLNSLSNDIIVSLCIDHQQKLWVGTYFGGLDVYDGKTFTHYKHQSNDTTSISDDRVWEIFEDSDYNLWIGTLRGGINRFDREKQIFHRYKIGPNSIQSLYTSAILEDKYGNIWFGTSEGIDVLNKKTNKFRHFSHRDNDPQSLIHDNVKNMLLDSRGLIWISTSQGLSMLNPKNNKFKNFQKEDGLPDNIVLDIQEDKHHNLWLSTSNGLSNLIVNVKAGQISFEFKNYDETDGLQGLEFNESASFKTKKGELIFGGANGFNIFKPEDIKTDFSIPVLVLSDLQIANKSVSIGEELDGETILQKAINIVEELILKYKHNVFSIEFTALNYFNPEKIKYKYMLEGFDKKWQEPNGNVRRATYTNLDPGDYLFKVVSTNSAGEWVSNENALSIKILPPFWRTWLAYLLYLGTIAGVLYLIRLRGIRKLRNEFALEQERQEAKRMHDLDMLKIKFFTNVSHEFRTPLSLIIAPMDKLISQAADESKKTQLQMVQRNSRRLLNLVNQLLDFRRLEVKELKLQPKYGDIINFIKDLSYSFTDIADKKNIKFSFQTDLSELVTSFDHDKIERILFNLLSNAFKFTHEGGKVAVSLEIEQNAKQKNQLILSVADNGIGIEEDKLDKIFERFFQNETPGSIVNQGSGIGLAITKEFVKLHGGDIKVESEIGKGSCFIVTIPIKIKAKSILPEEVLENDDEEDVAIEILADSSPTLSTKQVVLLVEDNEDFRFYLKDNLKEYFQVIEAANGKEGWQKALAQHPNLIVSDISMPEMDGIALCKKIKADSRTLHIPIILLTALTGEEQQLKGLETGATDYMTKPFNFEILVSKIKNILSQQESMRKTYQKQVEVKPTAIEATSSDETFVRNALDVVEQNISNADFSVEELSYEMHMSRVTLYKKILALTGKTPVEFIRMVRIKRAAQLLEKEHLTISQVGDKVGFKSQKYFVRVFKEEFNMIPSAYIEWVKSQTPKEKEQI